MPTSTLDSVLPHGHAVQFYENEAFLQSRVGEFLAEGLALGDHAVIFATAAHRDLFHDAIHARGVDASRLMFFDAEESLRKFMDGASVDESRFRRMVTPVLEKVGERARFYGEMVDLLWRGGNPEAAIRLEELWNNLARDYRFQLVCAYPMSNFYKEAHSVAFDEICGNHGLVWPTEKLTGEITDEQGRKIAALQQRASALENEIEHRRNVEKVLLDSLNARRLVDDAATLLHRSPDAERTFPEFVRLVTSRFAPVCAIDLLRDDETLERVAFESSDGAPPTLVVPLLYNERSRGTIGFGGRPFSEADRLVASDLAQRLAVALENARLYRLAQEGNRAKDEFLATLSHELRTPLTAILGWARMLRGDIIDPEMVQSALETIERSARAQAALIDDILDLSRVITGKLTLQIELVDLGAIVENAIATVRVAAAARQVDIQLRRKAEPAFVMGDATRLQQVVWNVLSNAVKFSPEDSVVTVDLRRTDAAARIVVRDRGAGISREFLPHVFEPFRQGQANTTRSYGGLGLGLAIVKHFVESHGGSVSVESEGEGRGATFTVALPLAARVKERLRRPVPESVGANLSGTSVLVVDDDRDTRTFVTAALKTYGANVMSADSVDEACVMLARQRPHVLVTDIAMPERDGFELLRHLRDNGDSIPTIALTALGRADDEDRIIAAGFDAYARKPFDPAEFADIVASVRDRSDA
jgi:signal transduction histidine kinase/ActR/RegA family two-component response regulator